MVILTSTTSFAQEFNPDLYHQILDEYTSVFEDVLTRSSQRPGILDQAFKRSHIHQVILENLTHSFNEATELFLQRGAQIEDISRAQHALFRSIQAAAADFEIPLPHNSSQYGEKLLLPFRKFQNFLGDSKRVVKNVSDYQNVEANFLYKIIDEINAPFLTNKTPKTIVMSFFGVLNDSNGEAIMDEGGVIFNEVAETANLRNRNIKFNTIQNLSDDILTNIVRSTTKGMSALTKLWLAI